MDSDNSFESGQLEGLTTVFRDQLLACLAVFKPARSSPSARRLHPQEKIGVRIEDVFVVGQNGGLIDLTAKLPHTADEVEAAMKAK